MSEHEQVTWHNATMVRGIQMVPLKDAEDAIKLLVSHAKGISGEQLDRTVEYVWLDIQGDVMSPVHQTLGAALSFADGWTTHYERISEARMELESSLAEYAESEHDRYEFRNIKDKIKKADRALAKLTKTGYAPRLLKRRVTTVTAEPLTIDEDTAVRIVIAS